MQKVKHSKRTNYIENDKVIKILKNLLPFLTKSITICNKTKQIY